MTEATGQECSHGAPFALSYGGRKSGQDSAVAMHRGWKGFRWLLDHKLDSEYQALFYNLTGLCAGRDSALAELIRTDLALPTSALIPDYLQDVAVQAADDFLFGSPGFSTLQGWRRASRPTGQIVKHRSAQAQADLMMIREGPSPNHSVPLLLRGLLLLVPLRRFC